MTKNLNQAAKDQIKDLIIQIAIKEKPESKKQLITLLRECHAIQPEQTASLLNELENEDRLHFPKQNPTTPASTKEYLFSSKAVWYWTTIALAVVAAMDVFFIPDTAYPLAYMRSAFGAIFVLFLPGFTFIRALFPVKVPVKTYSENMDTIERIVLSFGMSLLIAATTGLILNYTPWGIGLTPITLSLLAFTMVFATACVLREYQGREFLVKL